MRRPTRPSFRATREHCADDAWSAAAIECFARMRPGDLAAARPDAGGQRAKRCADALGTARRRQAERAVAEARARVAQVNIEECDRFLGAVRSVIACEAMPIAERAELGREVAGHLVAADERLARRCRAPHGRRVHRAARRAPEASDRLRTVSYVMVDIESDGPAPGLYSMVSFGAVIVRQPGSTETFYGQARPITDAYLPDALAVSGHSRAEHETFDDPAEVMQAFARWLAEHGGKRPMFISDNNGFDWSFINYYFHRFTGGKPVRLQLAEPRLLVQGRRQGRVRVVQAPAQDDAHAPSGRRCEGQRRGAARDRDERRAPRSCWTDPLARARFPAILRHQCKELS